VTGRRPAAESPLPNRIAELRERTKLSRLELAELVGVNSQTIGYLERGEYNPSLALAFRLSDVFSLPVEKIFIRTRSRQSRRS
jgi:DNA-binding XRE family transcriptional regulator